jgi:hypothetical protein
MAADQIMRRCKHCGKSTLHVGPHTSHLLHLVLSIITVGFWVPVWILVHLSHSTQLACSQCGQSRGLFG